MLGGVCHGTTNCDPYVYVEDGDQGHRKDEHREGGELENPTHLRYPFGWNVADEGIGYRAPGNGVPEVVVGPRVEGVR